MTRGMTALIADDHDLFKVGLAAMLKSDLGFDEVVEVSTLEQAIDRLRQDPPVSLATFDINMSGVMDVDSLEIVREEFPDLKMAIVSGSDTRANVLKALSIGLNGYVPKTMPLVAVVDALRTILAGHVFVPPLILSAKTEAAVAPPPTSTIEAVPEHLTPRQLQVLRCIAQGLSNKEIARALNLSDGTVKVHVNALFRTLGVHNRVSAASALNGSRH